MLLHLPAKDLSFSILTGAIKVEFFTVRWDAAFDALDILGLDFFFCQITRIRTVRGMSKLDETNSGTKVCVPRNCFIDSTMSPRRASSSALKNQRCFQAKTGPGVRLRKWACIPYGSLLPQVPDINLINLINLHATGAHQTTIRPSMLLVARIIPITEHTLHAPRNGTLQYEPPIQLPQQSPQQQHIAGPGATQINRLD